MMAIAAVGNNLITYVFNDMHFPLSKAANIVTNFIGTVFLLSLLGGFLSDSYLGSFATMLIFGFVELSVSPSPPPPLSLMAELGPGRANWSPTRKNNIHYYFYTKKANLTYPSLLLSIYHCNYPI